MKNRLHQIEALLLVDRLRHRFGLESPRPNLPMCFAGPPGTGTTSVATKMAEILHALGYLPTDRLVTVSREDLVGQYVGHTAPKTKDVLRRAMGRVLFIDEAYSLHRPDNERDYGQEAIEMLRQVMEEHRDRLLVILAGYRHRMDAFFALNPGLRSRIAGGTSIAICAGADRARRSPRQHGLRRCCARRAVTTSVGYRWRSLTAWSRTVASSVTAAWRAAAPEATKAAE